MSENDNALEANKGQEPAAGDLKAVKEEEVPAGGQEAVKEKEVSAGGQGADRGQETPADSPEPDKEQAAPVSHAVVGIRFRHCGKIYTFKVDDLDVVAGTRVVVESEMGLSLGFVARPKYIVAQKGEPFKKVLRIATEKDFETIEKNRSLEDEAKAFCIEKAREYKLEMKVVTTETTLDKKRLIFYFTSDGRIDFRDLVRDLAAKFKTRIEMRQIGVRDEVKMLGGIGCCGRQTCCSLFLTSFAPITIRMAKEQELSINQSKLSGICGRLMCCLGYEYKENGERRGVPSVRKETAVTVPKEQVQDTLQPAESLRRAAPDEEKEKVDTAPAQEKPVEEKKHGRRRRRRRGKGRFRQDKGAPEKKPQEKPSQERQPQHKQSQAKPETKSKSGIREQQPSEKKDKGRPFSKRRRFWKKKKTSHGKDSSN
jgi:cell fate regulator YaaT (PSP1 superfamily)